MDYWPTSAGSVILTSRDYALAGRPASAGELLDTLDSNDSFAFFVGCLKSWDPIDVEMMAAKRLLTLLEGLPLAIQQIAGLINTYECSVSYFLRLYEQHGDRLRSDRGYDTSIFYQHTLATVWSLSFDAFKKTPQTFFLLGIICLLAPDKIPQELFILPHNVIASNYLVLYQDEIQFVAPRILLVMTNRVKAHEGTSTTPKRLANSEVQQCRRANSPSYPSDLPGPF